MHEADEYSETINKTTSSTMPAANQPMSNCKEAAAKLEGPVVTAQSPANITPV